MENILAKTPKPPYWVVTFSTLKTDTQEGYEETAKKMVDLAQKQKGFLGIDSVFDQNTGIGITNSYWKNEDAILAWKKDAEHTKARAKGRNDWYKAYSLRVAKVTRAYSL